MSGNSTLLLSGEVSIVCDGDIKISGGSEINGSGDAQDLRVFAGTEQAGEKGAKKQANINIEGGSKVSALLYAPYSEIHITGNSAVEGRYFGREITVDGASSVAMDSEQVAAVIKPLSGIAKAGTADPKITLGQVYAFPNPAKGRLNPVIHVEVGIADSIEIRIYNIAAELVHSGNVSGNNYQVLDNKYVYEYTWDASNIASGVYLYVIKAEKSGNDQIKVIKKLAIVR